MSLASVVRSASVLVALVCISAVVAAPAAANTWNEIGDAGELPGSAQMTFGSGPLTTITGRLFVDTDVDMYCISITNEPGFTARYTPCSTHADPDMWLFSANGNGVTHADFCQGGSVSLTSQFVSTPGYYYLAVSGTNGDALRTGLPIWQSTNAIFSERAPDGSGAPGPITAWGGARVVSTPNYTILLTGAEFCDLPVPSEPRTWGAVKARYE
jgi:hypothetical protein